LLLLGLLVAACGNEPAPVVPVSFQRRAGRPGERFAVRIEHQRINQVSPHQSVVVTKKGDYVDEVESDSSVLRAGSFDNEEVRLTLTRREGHLVDDRGERQDAFAQFEALLPERPVRPGDRWQARDFWGAWGRFPPKAPRLRSVRAACVYRGREDGVATIHVEILAETASGPYAFAGSLVYDVGAAMLVRVELRGTGGDLRHVLLAERKLLR
jgi:hypothetical protein